MSQDAGWSIRCPGCGASLGALPNGSPTACGATSATSPSMSLAAAPTPALRCADCGAVWPERDGIWRLMASEDAARTALFVAEYTTVRRAEGRSEMSAAQRLALPYALATTPLAWQWGIRAASYLALCGGGGDRHRDRRGDRGGGGGGGGSSSGGAAGAGLAGIPPGRIVDVGAGGGWLSWRLAVGGWSALAVDISDDAGDGLGAATPYSVDLAARGMAGRLVRAIAHFDRLPLLDGAADAVVFNASLHYAVDPAATLAEAARVVRAGGLVCVVDSPIYRQRASGERMVAERTARFAARFGFPSTAQGSREFLVDGELEAIGASIGLRFHHIRPWAGLAWALRPAAARLRGRREPARFRVSIGVRVGGMDGAAGDGAG
ncbi:MAG: class I SAM-dependent methyltransferase [Ardenticatenales bacterium]